MVTRGFKTPFRAGLAAERRSTATTPGHCLRPGPSPHGAQGDSPAVVAAGSSMAPALLQPFPRPGDGPASASPSHGPPRLGAAGRGWQGREGTAPP